MKTREKKGEFQIKIFKRIKFLNEEYIKCITGHFLPCVLFCSCIFIVPDTMLKP